MITWTRTQHIILGKHSYLYSGNHFYPIACVSLCGTRICVGLLLHLPPLSPENFHSLLGYICLGTAHKEATMYSKVNIHTHSHTHHIVCSIPLGLPHTFEHVNKCGMHASCQIISSLMHSLSFSPSPSPPSLSYFLSFFLSLSHSLFLFY